MLKINGFMDIVVFIVFFFPQLKIVSVINACLCNMEFLYKSGMCNITISMSITDIIGNLRNEVKFMSYMYVLLAGSPDFVRFYPVNRA